MATRAPAAKGDALDKAALVKAVDKVQATRGLGVALRRHGRMEVIRSGHGKGGTVVFELRERYVDPAFLQQAKQGGAPWKTTVGSRQAGWSLMAPGARQVAWPADRTPKTPPPISRLPDRTRNSVPPEEWANLGLNCAGMVIAWVGVVGAGLLAPVTGGVTGWGAVVMYGGAVAGTGQCMASVYRVNNARRGRADINKKLDDSSVYKWTMRGADVVGLYSGKGGFKVAANAATSVKSVGLTMGDVTARAMSRATRTNLTRKLGLGMRPVGSRVISRAVKLQLLEGVGSVLGVVSSAYGGVVRELVVWVATEPGA